MTSFECCTVVKHHELFDQVGSRNWADLFALYHICRLAAPKHVLEIGYYQGFSFGLMFESCGADTEFTSCDINYSRDILSRILDVKKRTQFHQVDSLEFALTKKFDFVLIDGCHDYQHVSHELLAVSSGLTDQALVIVDDFDHYQYPGVAQAIKDKISQTNLVPVLLGHQQLVLGRRQLWEHELRYLSQSTAPFLSWGTKNWHTFVDIPAYQIKFAALLDVFLSTYQAYIKSSRSKSHYVENNNDSNH